MKKKTKYILLVVLSLMMALFSCFAFASCKDDSTGGNSGNGDSSYSGEQVKDPPNDGLPRVTMAITVLQPDGTPAANVKVDLYNLENPNEIYSAATTGSNGVATIVASDALEYEIGVSQLPNEYEYTKAEVITGAEGATKTIVLDTAQIGDVYYVVTVQSEYGWSLSGVTVTLKDGDKIAGQATTGEAGTTRVFVESLKEYTVELQGVPSGYSVPADLKTSTDSALTISLESKPIDGKMPSNKSYRWYEIMYDFSVIDTNGDEIRLSELLKTKKLVLINFWATWCGPCRGEFDDIQRAYEKYQDDVAVVALSIDDTMSEIIEFKEEYKSISDLTFYMAQDTNGLYSAFSVYTNNGSVPVSVLVDRNGWIAGSWYGSGEEAEFLAYFKHYTSDDYVQAKFNNDPDLPVIEPEKPDVEMPDTSVIEEAINKDGLVGEYRGPAVDGYWPWILDDEKNLVPGNIKHRNSTSVISLDVNIQPGYFLTFEYKMNIEDIGNSDLFSIYLDDSLMDSFYGSSDGWVTYYVYMPLENEGGEHTLRLMYSKDDNDSYLSGDEVLAIRNMHFESLDEIQTKGVSVNILREAGTGELGNNGWSNYVTTVLGDDGYYHVGTVDGPLLLANITGETRYSNTPISSLAVSGYFTIAHLDDYIFFFNSTGGQAEGSYMESLKSYSWLAGNSGIENYVPVDQALKNVLIEMTYQFSVTQYQGAYLARYYTENTWLDLCRYYDHYGSGKPIDNPLKGLCRKEAIEAHTIESGANHAVINRSLNPRGFVYKFQPTVSGAYRIYSQIDRTKYDYGGVVFVEGNRTYRAQDDGTDYNLYVQFTAGETYYISTAFEDPNGMGEFDFYIVYEGAQVDEFTYASDGSYTGIIDGQDEGITRHNNMHAALGEDGYYHQILSGNVLDSGEHSYIYVNMKATSYRFDASLEALAKGEIKLSENNGVKFFDFSNEEDGQDYSDIILQYVAQAGKADPNATSGEEAEEIWVKADARLVEILNKALARIDHRAPDSWFGLAYYYQHWGNYTPGSTSAE